MDKLVVSAGAALRGEIPINGSKNSALPALAAGLLTDEAVTLHRVPRVRDIRTMERLLVDIGTTVDVDGETVCLRTERILSPEAPYELVKTMRASSLVLGPLVARSGRARGPSICTSSAWSSWALPSTRRTVTLRPWRRMDCAALSSTSSGSRSPAPKTRSEEHTSELQ